MLRSRPSSSLSSTLRPRVGVRVGVVVELEIEIEVGADAEVGVSDAECVGEGAGEIGLKVDAGIEGVSDAEIESGGLMLRSR
ncbi:hypothetical protein FRC10_000573, partial [Ceratobasidium sp. 414]